MPKEFSRTRRVAEQLQRELAPLIARELDDPRIGMVTITGVDVSRDYANATVWVTRVGSASEIEESIQALNHAAGFLRHKLSMELNLRSTPRLKFRYDKSVEEGAAMHELLERLSGGRTDSGRGE
jgi:ribosome-binding factor A